MTRHTTHKDSVRISAGERAMYQELADRDSAWIDLDAREKCYGMLARIPFGGGLVSRKVSLSLHNYLEVGKRITQNRATSAPAPPTPPERTDPMPAPVPTPTSPTPPAGRKIRLNFGQVVEEFFGIPKGRVEKLMERQDFPKPVVNGPTNKSRKWLQSDLELFVADHPTAIEETLQRKPRAGSRLELEKRVTVIEDRQSELNTQQIALDARLKAIEATFKPALGQTTAQGRV